MNKKTLVPILLAAMLAVFLLPAAAFAEEAVQQDEYPYAPLGETVDEEELGASNTPITSITLTGLNTNLIPGVLPTYSVKVSSIEPGGKSLRVLQEAWYPTSMNDYSNQILLGPDPFFGRDRYGNPVAGMTYYYSLVVGLPGDLFLSDELTVTVNGKSYEASIITSRGMTSNGSGQVVFGQFALDGFKVTPAVPVPLYRMYNTKTSEHLWTRNKAEYDSCGSGSYADWKQENVAWYVPKSSAKPVYRLYNLKSGDHHYTTSVGEKDKLVASGQWRDEGVAFYSASKDDEQVIAIYRVYNSKLKRGQHHYTKSAAERDSLVKNNGWKDEGVGFYGYKSSKLSETPPQPYPYG